MSNRYLIFIRMPFLFSSALYDTFSRTILHLNVFLVSVFWISNSRCYKKMNWTRIYGPIFLFFFHSIGFIIVTFVWLTTRRVVFYFITISETVYCYMKFLLVVMVKIITHVRTSFFLWRFKKNDRVFWRSLKLFNYFQETMKLLFRLEW